MGLFFFSVDFVFQTNSRFRKLLVYNAKSLALYRIATSGQSGRLRLQATSLLYLFAKKYPSFSRRIYFYQIGARDGTWTHTPFGIRTSSVRVYHSTTRAGVK
ncbi:MAG: hypothetical protein ACD_78C00083G0001, partial [uncultured bacterium (gcode 4)]